MSVEVERSESVTISVTNGRGGLLASAIATNGRLSDVSVRGRMLNDEGDFRRLASWAEEVAFLLQEEEASQ